jgi:hypothetical protein
MSHLTVFDQNNYKPRFQNAYEYLNNIKLEIRGLKSSIELEVNDIVCIVGISELTNILLTRIGVCVAYFPEDLVVLYPMNLVIQCVSYRCGQQDRCISICRVCKTVWIGYRTSLTKRSGNKSFYIISACASNSL